MVIEDTPRHHFHRSAASRSATFLTAAAALAALLATTSVYSDTWTGWRGGEREGRSESAAAPVYWSAADNVAWRSPIPGVGHSSPILTEDALLATTATEIRRHPVAASIVGGVVVLGLVVVLGMGIASVVRSVQSPDTGRAGRDQTLISLGVLLGLAAMILLFGRSLFAFGQAAERAWLAAGLVGTLLLAADWVRARLAAGPGSLHAGSLLAFGAILLITVPEGIGTALSEPDAPRSVLVCGVVALPLIVGLLLLGRSFAEERIFAQATRWLAGMCIAGLGVAMAGAAMLQRGRGGHVVSVAELHTPAVRWWMVLALILLTAVLLAVRRRARQSAGLSLLAVLAGVLTTIAAIVAAIEHTVAWWPYLGYHAGQLRLEPDLGWVSVALVAGLSVALAAAARLHGGAPVAGLSGPAQYLWAPALALAYLFSVLYVPNETVFARGIVCIDRADGAQLWTRLCVQGPQGRFHRDNSAATPTPVTDGEHVVAWFGTPGLLCTDMTGAVLWLDRSLPFDSREGVASSPIIYNDSVIVLAESAAGGSLAAFDIATGVQRWRIERGKKIHPDAGNCRTPSIVGVGGRPTLVVWGLEDLSGYDPDTGEQLWSHDLGSFGEGGNPVSSVIRDDTRLYLLGPHRSVAVAIDRLAAASSPVVWDHPVRAGAQCSSPVLVAGMLFAVSDSGSVYCLDAATGRELWRHNIGGQHYASPVAVGNAVYFSNTRGVTTVVAAEAEYRELSNNELPEGIYASAAPVDGCMYLRTTAAVYCIADLGAVRPEATSSTATESQAVTAAPASPGAVNLSEGWWAQFRGPFATGVTTLEGPEPGFDIPRGKGLIWTASVPLPGRNSPVVWDDAVFLTAADERTQEVLCFDAGSGVLRWRQSVTGEKRGEALEVSADTGYAAPSPVTDGRRVCAIFATGDLGCFGMDGQPGWSKSLGVPANSWGHATSLLIHNGMLLVQYDQESDDVPKSRLLALDAATGKTTWEAKRDVPASWATPLIVTVDGHEEIITCANPWVIAYDPTDGRELWRAECLSGDVAPSPTVADGMIIVAMDGSACSAIRPGGSGNVTSTHIAWSFYGMLPDICSPVGTDEFVFLLSTYGYLTCVNAQTGEMVWEQQLDGAFKASPVIAGDRLYLLGDDGKMLIIKPGNSFELLGEGKVGEGCEATPAFAPGRMFIRGVEHLFCVESGG